MRAFSPAYTGKVNAALKLLGVIPNVDGGEMAGGSSRSHH